MDEQLKEIKNYIATDREDIKEIKEDIVELKIKMQKNDILTEQSIENGNKLRESIDTLKTTMVEIAQSVKDSNRINGEITKTIEEMGKKIVSVEKNTNESLKEFGNKIDEIDEKSKVDILLWAKANWFGIIGILGIIYTALQHFKIL